MGSVMDDEEGADSQSRPTTHTTTNSEKQDAGARRSQGEDEGNPRLGVSIYLFNADKGVIEPLNVPARNTIVHNSPALVKHAVANTLQRQANKKGLYEHTSGCVVHWKPSAIPFHIEFEVSVSKNTCQHLASVRNIKAKNADQYAKSLVPLAKIFLDKPHGSHLPHLPFTRPQIPSDDRSNRNAEDKRTTETIQHARLIVNQHKSLTEVDIKTAETTARMVNAGKILSGFLVYLTSPKPRIEDAVMSTEPSTTKDKGYRPTDRPFSAAPKLPKPISSVDELQGLGDVMKYKRVVSNPKNDISMAMGTESTTLGENSRPEDTSAVEKPMPEKRAAALWSSKRGKESKKNNQGRKQILNGRTRTPATFTVSPYPTQRPPRKRPTRKPIIVRESSEGAKLGPEDQDLNKVSGTRWRHLEGSDHNEITLEQSLSPEESRQKDLASPECASGKREESEFHMAEEVFDPESIPAGVELSPSDIIHGEDLIALADKPLAFSLPTKPIQKSRSGVQGLMWAYATKGRIDESLGDAGVWFWRKPETHFRTQPPLRTEKFDHSVLAPVVVSHERTGNDEPIVELYGDTVHILPHEQCWEDIRSHEFHPDFLIPWKLAEYQASEAAGYQVWRHDRELLECRKPGCHAMISDYHRSAVVCLGCGPKSVVRYCSLQHQLEDVEGHWKECGTWGLTLQCVIDHTTAPSKFARMCPAIKQRHGRTTAALHRQVLYCALTYGHYTLFHSAPNRSETLCWPKQDPKWPEMDRRIERLLNVAFFDSWNTYVLGYLYRLLRDLLRARGRWSQSIESSLKLQLETEFINYKVNTNWHNGDAPCQCEWSGKFLPRYDHLSTCWEYSPAAAHDGPVWRQNCIEATVVDYEERFWILRAWRQQHPTQNNWRLRAAGYGFPSTIPDEDCYDLGPGWTGWGGEKDNICEDQFNQGEKLSMRSI